MSSSNSPCAACKFLRRKCTQECVFAPYFPADQPQRFANVHRVFGASNVAKILNELDKSHREDAVNSLAYEAEARLRDPVYGCVGLISNLQQMLKNLQINLDLAKKELASMVGPDAMLHMLHDPYLQSQIHPIAAAAAQGGGRGAMVPYNMGQMMGMMPTGPGPGPLMIGQDPQHQQLQSQSQQLVIRDNTNVVQQQHQHHHLGQRMMRDAHLQAKQEQQHAMEAQQLAAAMMQVREEQEIMRNYDHQQQHISHFHPQHHHQLLLQQQQPQQQHPHQLLRFDGNEYEAGGGGGGGDGVEFCQMGTQGTSTSPLLALGGSGFEGNPYQIQQQHQQEQQPLLLLQQPQHSDSEAVQTIEHQQQPVEHLFHEHPSGSGHEESRTGGPSC